MIKYPNGTPNKKVTHISKAESKARKSLSSANRGMDLESDINLSNEYYLEKDLCVITKRPTPINVVKVDYTKGAIITNAYFEKQSTTDYNGVYKGRYIDFEAKSTKIKTSFPLHNITSHQIKHLERVLAHNGIAFFIIEFASRNEVYLLDAAYVIEFYKHGERQSIPYDVVKEKGHLIPRGFSPRLDYLPIVDKIYCKN